jgi:hypothetical protein
MDIRLYRQALARFFLGGTLVALLTLSSCASGPEIVDHAFSFDARRDGQENVEVLDYRYGNSKLPVRADETRVKAGDTFGFQGVHGPMLRGDFLYVKWRIKTTGQIYEDTVDLRSRLPANITDCRIHFLIRGSQLYVYLITPQKRPIGEPPNGPKMYDDLKTLTIYPDKEASRTSAL